jgi:hypothetical protein
MVLALLAGCGTAGAQAAETRCGWLQNPTPGNWWLDDKNGTWVMATQGGRQAKGLDTIPDFPDSQYVKTNGPHGYGCACLTVDVNVRQKLVTRVRAARLMPLSRCRGDKSLPKP